MLQPCHPSLETTKVTMKKLAIYGAGGFGREIACLINHINMHQPTWDFIGFFDDGIPAGTAVGNYGCVIGGLQELNNWSDELSIVFSIADPHILHKVFIKIENDKLKFPNIVAPNVLFLDKETVQMGIGNIIFFGCKISCDVKIGNFNLLNGTASLGHDVVLGDFNVIGPMVRLSGSTIVGNQNFFGVQSIVHQGIKIGNNTKIGACSYVLRKTVDGALYFGNPAKKIVL